ncbi:glycosyltransferase [Pedobacter boryungensis]|uniref:Glycosyltransferase n=1 Tax=Pedobacter boryungensis TaxID=869962 RepID=A0ABX2DCB8_9SPHI|nr:glycosyltransferase [Pedobacter boryungensis]NQX31728.1 glycosyltransferase [Pedobacter boryungensis]
MQQKELISIALCTYNGSKYIEQQVNSILNQSYKNIEIVAVDDNSTDNTYHLLEKLQEQHAQLKIYRNEKNLGFNKNFEKAIKLCNGKYIAISDQDDIWLPQKLELLVNNIGNNWLIFSNSEWVDENEVSMGKQILNPSFTMEGRGFKSILFYNSVTGHTVLFDKQFVDYFTPMPAKGYYDWWMGFVALYHNKATCLNKCLTLHRMHNSSVTSGAYSNDKKQFKKDLNVEAEIQLEQFKHYKNLKPKDKKFIEKISCEYSKNFSFYLMWLLLVNYPTYFPDKKPRNWLSRLNFARKLK